ncbi:kinesin-like protein KIN-7O [Silene latifolia]|uniref:kinesin-like protein KIN-7O n=1 Tax=Silene latifolia TaxID=37657 RepID=UPI003D77332A
MERIYVTVRARPLSSEDAKSTPWKISGNSISFANTSSKFDFDRVFREDCKTQEVYESRTKEIVTAAVRGFNGTVFAYGQTNSGKTHTMRGSSGEPGVIPLAVREIFDIIEEVPDREFLLRMSYMEIYNEEINDLLVPDHRRLQIHESLERGIFVAGLREEIVASPEQVLDLMEFGESHRHIGETNMNLHSSRSHTIFRMIIESRDKAGDDESGDSCDAVRVSVLNLVDLAGSERAAKTGAEGVRLKEGSHINKSLMTLGTVIKKLSEGAEGQGGHVPYRDSKLTRILQPALGGNANTAIICNITLAQIHADETKSSLQFASRALRVTNCAQVNEILTDAALLKRQKREIEELRAKLQASQSEHPEEDIFHLRNTLLQTELERERIALELEEEKRAQIEREKRLEEQDKKIKNLSSMVLYSNRDEIRDYSKKDKRRDTWCPGKLLREASKEKETPKKLDSRTSGRSRQARESEPLVPFDELVAGSQILEDTSNPEIDRNDRILDDSVILPDPSALLKVTNRKKSSQKKKNTLVVNNELRELEMQYEDLLLKFEAQRIMYEVQIDCLKRKLSETHENNHDPCTNGLNDISTLGDMHSVDTDANYVIEQLKKQIKELQVEKVSGDRNLENAIDLAKKQNTFATERYEKLYAELQMSKEEAIARDELRGKCNKSMEEGFSNSVSELLLEVKQTLDEAQNLSILSGSMSSVTEELLESHSSRLTSYLYNFKLYMCENAELLKSIFDDHGKLINCLKNRISELESEKLQLQSKSEDLIEQLQGVNRNAQNTEKAFASNSEQYELEKSELLSHIEILEREIYSLSSSSLSKEKESLRKEFEKTRAKLKETESKLKNTIQEKTRLEGERANAEREIKKLHGQKALLERDINKRESLAGRRRDSCLDRPRAIDAKKARGQENSMQQTLQEDYRTLEVLASEMETTIASLEEELAAANLEKEEMLARNESLSFELEMLSDKLETSNTDLTALNEELLELRSKVEVSEASYQKMDSQMSQLMEEKEELATQLTNALLEMEEERAVWSAKEKASIETIKDKASIYNDEVTALSSELLKVRNEMISLSKEYEVLQEKLKDTEEHTQLKSLCSTEKSLEIDQLRHALEVAKSEKMDAEKLARAKLDALSLDHSLASEEVQKLQQDLATLRKEREDLSAKVKDQELAAKFSSDLQISKSQLLHMEEERNIMMAEIEKLQGKEAEVALLGKACDEKISRAQLEAEQLSGKLADLEHKMHDDGVKNGKERTKLRMRLGSTQAKLDALRERYKDAIEEQEFMHKKFEEASSMLKDRLASYGLEILNLKKQIATSKAS